MDLSPILAILIALNGFSLAACLFSYIALKRATDDCEEQAKKCQEIAQALNKVHNELTLQLATIGDKLTAHDFILGRKDKLKNG